MEQASARAAAAERTLRSLQQLGEQAATIGAQRELDEATEAYAEAEHLVAQAAAALAEVYPRLAQVTAAGLGTPMRTTTNLHCVLLGLVGGRAPPLDRR